MIHSCDKTVSKWCHRTCCGHLVAIGSAVNFDSLTYILIITSLSTWGVPMQRVAKHQTVFNIKWSTKYKYYHGINVYVYVTLTTHIISNTTVVRLSILIQPSNYKWHVMWDIVGFSNHYPLVACEFDFKWVIFKCAAVITSMCISSWKGLLPNT